MGEICAYIMVGLTGSGKSRWAKMKHEADKLVSVNTLIVEGDSIRKMFYGTYHYHECIEPLVMTEILHITECIIKTGYNVIIDEMLLSLTSQKRRALIRVLKSMGFGKIIFVQCKSDLEGLQRRIENDPRGYTPEKWMQVYEENKAQYEEFIADDEGHDFVVEA